ncbi:hypothetical protein R1flu_021223 [Riccia fluitans]|uniref:Uncharacterized protein n=1 Tax=Riccia fluitans TaxID=41844 RepID=A0ABD1ZP29_9MARC
MATLLMRASRADGTGGGTDKKRRARKGKNAQKRQPQRGLGVAQLEKLRLQEQSLLCATTSATTSSSYSVRLYTPAAELTMSRCDADVAQTVLSLAYGAAASCLMRENGGQSSSSGNTHLQSLQEKSNGEPLEASNRLAASRAALASCLRSQNSKFSAAAAANVPFFSSSVQQLTGAANPLEVVVYDCEGKTHEKEEEAHELRSRLRGHSGELTSSNAPPPPFCIYSAAIQNLKELAAATGSPVDSAAAAGYKLQLSPVFKDVSRIPIAITDPHYIESLLGSDHILPHGTTRKRVELPVVGASPNADKPKELHSFQNLQTSKPGAAWSSPDKASGRKRPWLAIQENGRQESEASQALDLNAPAGGELDNELNIDRHCPPVTQDLVFENRVGAHYTTGIVRSALGNSCLSSVKMKASSSCSVLPWQDSERPSSASGYFSDMALYTAAAAAAENGVLFKQSSASPSVARDSCSSATGPASYLTLSRSSRCLNETPETPSPVGKESICSSNFLTLGISNSFYPRDGWHEPEESTQDTMMSINLDVSKLKQRSSSGCEGDEGLQTRSPITQELDAVDLEKHRSMRSGSALQSQNVFSPARSSSSFGANNSLRCAGTGADDILDLRLKLAL